MSSIINASTSGGLISTADTSGILKLQTAGTDAVTIDASQRVGVGITPSAWGSGFKAAQVGTLSLLSNSGANSYFGNNWYYNGTNDVYMTSNAASQYVQTAGAHIWKTVASGTAGATLSWTQAMTLDASGRLGIGTTGPNTKLEIAGAGATADPLMLRLSNASDLAYYWDLWRDNTTGSLNFGSATGGSKTTKMSIDSSGNLLVGGTTAGAKVRIETNLASQDGLDIKNTSATTGQTFVAFFNSTNGVAGSITQSTATTVLFNTTSDYRLKTVLGAVTDQGARIDALKPVDYIWTDGGQAARGFLAHEFAEVYANSVTGTKDAVDADGKPKHQSMQAATSEVIADLVAEIQSLRTRLAALEGAAQ